MVEGVTRHFVRRLQQPGATTRVGARIVSGGRRSHCITPPATCSGRAAGRGSGRCTSRPRPPAARPGRPGWRSASMRGGHVHGDGQHPGAHRVLEDGHPHPEPVPAAPPRPRRGHERAAGQAWPTPSPRAAPGRRPGEQRLQHLLLEVDQVEGDVAAERPRDLVEEVGDVLRTGVTQVRHHRLDVEHARTVSRRGTPISRTGKVTTWRSTLDPYSAGVRGIKADPFPDDDSFVTLVAGRLDTADGAQAAAGVATPHARRPGSAPERSPELAHMNLARLRTYRRTLLEEELRASYWRRLLQARRDLLRANTAPGDRIALTEALTEQRGPRPASNPLPAPRRRDAGPAAPAGPVGQRSRRDDRRGASRRCSPGSPPPRASCPPTGRRCTSVSTAPTSELVARYHEDPSACLVALEVKR